MEAEQLFREKDETGERSMQELFMQISHRYAGKCFYVCKELGLYPGQVPILAILRKKDGYSQKELANRLGVKPPTVTVSIQRLEKTGLLCRKQDENDQRITRIYLTGKGRETIREGMRLMEQLEQSVFGGFSETELCLMRRFFMQILANIENVQIKPTKKEGQNE